MNLKIQLGQGDIMITKRIFLSSLQVSLFLLFVFLVGGCARYGHVVLEDETGSVSVEVNRGASQGHYESTLPKIPPGQMPLPGQCRIWYPEEPPGKQPPPGDCRELRKHVPPGAWLIRG